MNVYRERDIQINRAIHHVLRRVDDETLEECHFLLTLTMWQASRSLLKLSILFAARIDLLIIPRDNLLYSSNLIRQTKERSRARFAEGAAMDEKRGPANLGESHRRAERRVYRRVPDVHHGTITTSKWIEAQYIYMAIVYISCYNKFYCYLKRFSCIKNSTLR